LYTAPFLLTNSAIVSANAFATGFNNSITAKAAFTIAPGFSFIGTGSLNNSVFTVQLSGPANQTYVLEGSTDFITWTPVNTNVPASSPFQLVDPQAGIYQYRFYRAVQLP
jgi:hypothetical protein